VTNFVWYVFSAGGAVTGLLVGAVWVIARPSSRRARRTLLALAAGYTLASTYLVGHGIDRLLAAGYEPISRRGLPNGRTAIVVLGSGAYTAIDWDDNAVTTLDIQASMRVIEAARVFRLTNAEWVISSGGLVEVTDNDEPSGTAMRDALVRLGVPAERILVEVDSRTTHDEAVIVASMLAKLDAEHVILVTSDIHMRRSLGAFRAVGINAVPAIARHRQDSTLWLGRYLPSEAGLHETADAAHEIIGIVYYAARGWFVF